MYRKLITVKSLSYNYPHCGNPALDNLCFEIHAGERLALLGANGSGKSTLLGCISGLLSPPPHTIHIYDGDLSTLDPSNEGDLEKIRLRIAVVLQNPDAQIISSIVEEDTAFGPENLGLDKVEIRKRVDAALRRAGLEQYRKRQARFLSGGERQRLALAGALALDAKLIALDEAMSMLDPLGRDDFLALLDELAGAGKTIVQVTHSLEEALCCNRALVLYQGRIVFDGLPQELLNREELETWGFALPEQVKLFRLFRKETQSDCLAFTVDAAQAADNIAVAMKALPQNIQAEYDGTALNTNNNLSPDSVNLRNLNHGVTRSFWYEKHLSPPCNSVELRGENSLKNAALHMEPAAAPAVAFINASHKYSSVFSGGINKINFEIPRGQFIALIQHQCAAAAQGFFQ
jgi:energy-coupling factor transporter ATP-binding protein EcfA2